MERMITSVIGTRPNGTKIVRNYFINDPTENLLAKAQSYFSKHEKKVAKLKHKNNN